MRDISTADKRKRVNSWLQEHYYSIKIAERPEVVPGSLLHTLLVLDAACDELVAMHGTTVDDQATDIYLAMYNLVQMAEKGGWNA